jgi:hypothetical protein
MKKLSLVICMMLAFSAPALAKRKHRGGGSSIPAANCNELGNSFKRRMANAPYKKFADKQVKKCVATYTVSNKTMPLFVAAAFYFKSYDVRLDAASRLEEYACEDKKACEAFYDTLNRHIEKMEPSKDSEKFFQGRINKLRDKAKASVDEEAK